MIVIKIHIHVWSVVIKKKNVGTYKKCLVGVFLLNENPHFVFHKIGKITYITKNQQCFFNCLFIEIDTFQYIKWATTRENVPSDNFFNVRETSLI